MKARYIPNDLLIPRIRQFLDEGHTATIRVRGRSMRPFLQDGRDKVVLAPCSAAVETGDVVLAETSPLHFVLHRVIAKDGDRLTLKGDGNVRGTESCREKDVVGVATAFIRKEKEQVVPTDSLRWRAYSYIWMRLNAVRRYALFTCRLLGL